MSERPGAATNELDVESQSVAWFALVDAGKGEASWSAAGALFREALDPARWDEQLRAAREPLGPLTSRVLAVEETLAAIPGVPDAKYVVRQYHSVYDRIRAVTETLTLQLEGDGVWRVVGYFIR
jgi:Protein of unknown function (DUF4019)